ncbi:MAG: zinc metallopeptidase [Bacteroidales bacterium]|nr:zinc metallopeptidase [Bacteroidales bacterium]
MTLWILIGVIFLISLIINKRLKSKMKRYSTVAINHGLTGKDIAEKMLRENGISDVAVVSTSGELTDHYNPVNKTINLSREVYQGSNVTAAAIAAHECGHALQHAHGYAPLKLRSSLVPIQNVSARILNMIFFAMIFGTFILPQFINYQLALYIIVACYSVFTAFAFITLPVEINASNRALAWLSNAGITQYGTDEKAQDALKWAAYTYVVAALSSLVMLLYYVAQLIGIDD